MRWADIDVLNHVNNVTYLEYAAEAQGLLSRSGEVPALPPTEVTVTFLVPAMLSRVPVRVVSMYDGDTLTQEVRSGEGGAVVNARVVSRWGQPAAPVVPSGASGPRPMRLRLGDLSGDGVVTVPKTFELIQETRVPLMAGVLDGLDVGRFVVGTVAAQRHRPLSWTGDDLEAYGWISRVGRGSATVRTVLQDNGGTVISADSTLVGFDLATQTSRPFADDERETLAAAVIA